MDEKLIKIWLLVFCDWWSHWADNITCKYFCLSFLGGYMLAYTPPHWHAMLWFGWCNPLFSSLTYILRVSVDLSKCDFSTDNGNYCNKDMKPLLRDNHFFLDSNAPIIVKSARGRGGIGRGFDIFQKIAVKFPTPGQKCEVKYNWNSPPREMICGQMFAKYSNIPTPGPKRSIKCPPNAGTLITIEKQNSVNKASKENLLKVKNRFFFSMRNFLKIENMF